MKETLIQEVEVQSLKSVKKENLYVMSHDDDRTDRVANALEEKLDHGKILLIIAED